VRTLTLNSTFGAALVALALAGCPGDSSDETTTDPTNSTPSQTDPTPGTTTTEGTTVENPTSSTNPDDTTGTPPDDTTANPDDTTGTPPDDTTANPDDTTGTPDDTTGTPDDTTGAPDDTTASGGGLSFAADVYGPILMARCSCHVNGVSGGLAMPDAATAYTNLVGTPAGQAPLDRVSAGDSEASYLFHKVNGSHLDVGGSGGKMPQGGMLEPAQVTTIADWIDQGALP
jgi:hypothetical protein